MCMCRPSQVCLRIMLCTKRVQGKTQPPVRLSKVIAPSKPEQAEVSRSLQRRVVSTIQFAEITAEVFEICFIKQTA